MQGATPVVGVSPVIGGMSGCGHADARLDAIGVDSSAAGVAGLYEDFLDGWLVAPDDPASVRLPRVEVRRLRQRPSGSPPSAGVAFA